jgi:hypothetical protein
MHEYTLTQHLHSDSELFGLQGQPYGHIAGPFDVKVTRPRLMELTFFFFLIS